MEHVELSKVRMKDHPVLSERWVQEKLGQTRRCSASVNST